MKPIFEKINPELQESIHVHTAVHPHLVTPLHYHPEAEIIHVVKSFGTRIVGESIQNFQEGDLVMIGSGVPHVWRNDEVYYQDNSNLEAKVRVIHFDENFGGEAFTQLPEMESLRKLFQLTKRGIQFTGQESKLILQHIDQVFEARKQKRIIAFINLLDYISYLPKYSFLMATEYQGQYNQKDCDKINRVYEYLLNSYTGKVEYRQLASELHMSLPSLCRYFKQRTHRNITTALNEIRINQACKLFSTENYSTTQVCFMVGYSNYSHFNEQFKKIIGTTPLKYRKKLD